jgi:hypothetical protein
VSPELIIAIATLFLGVVYEIRTYKDHVYQLQTSLEDRFPQGGLLLADLFITALGSGIKR